MCVSYVSSSLLKDKVEGGLGLFSSFFEEINPERLHLFALLSYALHEDAHKDVVSHICDELTPDWEEIERMLSEVDMKLYQGTAFFAYVENMGEPAILTALEYARQDHTAWEALGVHHRKDAVVKAVWTSFTLQLKEVVRLKEEPEAAQALERLAQLYEDLKKACEELNKVKEQLAAQTARSEATGSHVAAL